MQISEKETRRLRKRGHRAGLTPNLSSCVIMQQVALLTLFLSLSLSLQSLAVIKGVVFIGQRSKQARGYLMPSLKPMVDYSS